MVSNGISQLKWTMGHWNTWATSNLQPPGNLASLALSAFVNGDVFDFQKLYEVTKVVTKNLNKVIDRNYYPVET